MLAEPSPPTTTRRSVVLGGIGLCMAGDAAASADAAPAKRLGKPAPGLIPVIDTHQHMWDLSRLRLDWLPKQGPLAGSHTMADYEATARGTGIVGSVYMEVDLDPAQHDREADLAIEMCRRPGNPMVAAVIGGRPGDPGFERYIRRFRGVPEVRGVRQVLFHPETPRGYCLRETFVRSMRLLGEMGMLFDVCVPAEYLPDADALCRYCPDTTFILDHCGTPGVQTRDLSPWKRDIDAVARNRNAVCKISGIVATARPGAWRDDDLAPIVRHCIGAFGWDRVVFGGDWPVCTQVATLPEWLASLRRILATEQPADVRRLLYGNAARLYRLRP